MVGFSSATPLPQACFICRVMKFTVCPSGMQSTISYTQSSPGPLTTGRGGSFSPTPNFFNMMPF